MRKALEVGADAVVFDLESAIPRGEADTARSLVRDVFESTVAGSDPALARPARFVRVSDVRADEFDPDVEASMHDSVTGILLPQVAGPHDVEVASRALDRLDPTGRVVIVPLVETANAVRLAYEVATASPRVAYFGAGVSRNGDIARAIGYRWTASGDETIFLRSKVLVDARAAGIHNPITGIWGDVADLDGLRRFAMQSRELGYEGLMCIHPSHLPVIHDVFTPSADELHDARAVIDTMRAAEAEGLGAVQLGGRLIDAAHVHTAEALLERARRLGVPIP
jgi:citrate lyase subunit beta/citryl-CoA lyase